MKKELAIENLRAGRPITFMDEIWPTKKYQDLKPGQLVDPLDEMDCEPFGWTELRRWRIQTLLASSPWGVPLTLFPRAFEGMFTRKFRTQEYGYDVLIHMVLDRPDIFTVLEPGELTEILFPDQAQDKVLHDARFCLDFNSVNSSIDSLLSANTAGYFSNNNWDKLNSLAWLNRDDVFPSDVVLAGEEFCDFIMPLSQAKLPSSNSNLDSLGVYKATIVSVASPETIYLNMKGPDAERVFQLTNDVTRYFQEKDEPIYNYRIPEEFIYAGYPCLLFVEDDHTWERCRILEKIHNTDRIIVDVIDYGGLKKVRRQDLYLMPKVFFDFAPQAVTVSLAGVKPVAEKWCTNAGARIRCFSYIKYYLDILLLPLKNLSTNETGESQGDKAPVKPKKSKLKKRPAYEVIICDRNDDELDIYLDKILCIEGYAARDQSRVDKLEMYRKELDEVFKNIERPENPMIGTFLTCD